jgi:hypothetical protein
MGWAPNSWVGRFIVHHGIVDRRVAVVAYHSAKLLSDKGGSVKEFTLTPRQLEHINIQRKVRGKSPLGLEGFQDAVTYAWGEPHLRPITIDDWIAYLILYECFCVQPMTVKVSGGLGLTIRPCPGHTL